jgi:flavoprotein
VPAPALPDNPGDRFFIQGSEKTPVTQAVPAMAVVKRKGKSIQITAVVSEDDFTSVRVYKWNKKKKKWQRKRYELTNYREPVHNFSIPSKKRGKYRVVAYDIVDGNNEVLQTFKITKKKRLVVL